MKLEEIKSILNEDIHFVKTNGSFDPIEKLPYTVELRWRKIMKVFENDPEYREYQNSVDYGTYENGEAQIVLKDGTKVEIPKEKILQYNKIFGQSMNINSGHLHPRR